jgi:hypothetical protein
MNEEEIKLKWKVFEKRKGHAHARKPLYFHSQKRKQVNHRIQGDVEGNIMFAIVGGGGGGYFPSTNNILQSPPISQ